MKKEKAAKQLVKLRGVVIAIKDVAGYKGHEGNCSSKILERFESVLQCYLLYKIIRRRSVIIGSCNC